MLKALIHPPGQFLVGLRPAFFKFTGRMDLTLNLELPWQTQANSQGWSKMDAGWGVKGLLSLVLGSVSSLRVML